MPAYFSRHSLLATRFSPLATRFSLLASRFSPLPLSHPDEIEISDLLTLANRGDF